MPSLVMDAAERARRAQAASDTFGTAAGGLLTQ